MGAWRCNVHHQALTTHLQLRTGSKEARPGNSITGLRAVHRSPPRLRAGPSISTGGSYAPHWACNTSGQMHRGGPTSRIARAALSLARDQVGSHRPATGLISQRPASAWTTLRQAGIVFWKDAVLHRLGAQEAEVYRENHSDRELLATSLAKASLRISQWTAQVVTKTTTAAWCSAAQEQIGDTACRHTTAGRRSCVCPPAHA